MRTVNLIITGVGGQGVLLVTRVLAEAALEAGGRATVGEVHGMAQRGGAVVSTVRFGPATSPLIGRAEADAILALEPMEALRVLDRASPRTIVVTSMKAVAPLLVVLGRAEYPPVGDIFQDLMGATRHVYGVDADGIAADLGAPVVANVVLMGALLGTGVLPLDLPSVRSRLAFHVPPETLEVNLQALDLGLQLATEKVESFK